MADVASPTARAVNKVEINGKTVIDLTQDTVTPETLKKGVTAHSASGEQITGTAEEDLSLGMTSVAVGDFIRVKSVDTNGKPTSWEPVQAEEAETVDVDLLPAVTAEDNDKVLQVVEGAWQAKDLPVGGGEDAWEKIADVALTADTSIYEVANFGVYRKIKILMSRAAYVSGLKNNVWFRIRKLNETGGQYAALYMTIEYGYITWEVMGEIGETFTWVQKITSNNPIAPQSAIKTVDILSPANPGEYGFYIDFINTSVIQDGDTVAVYGVKR